MDSVESSWLDSQRDSPHGLSVSQAKLKSLYLPTRGEGYLYQATSYSSLGGHLYIKGIGEKEEEAGGNAFVLGKRQGVI